MPEPYTYFIAGRISQKGHMLACHRCGRKILVEIGLCGVSHNVNDPIPEGRGLDLYSPAIWLSDP